MGRADDHPVARSWPATHRPRASYLAVLLAGNVADLGAQVIGAAADGALAAIGFNSELLQEDVLATVEHRRQH